MPLQMSSDAMETLAAIRSLGRMDASFMAHIFTILSLVRQAAAAGGVLNTTMQPLVDLITTFVSISCPALPCLFLQCTLICTGAAMLWHVLHNTIRV